MLVVLLSLAAVCVLGLRSYPGLLGVKVVNLTSNAVVRLLGKVENTERFTRLALYQGKQGKLKVRVSECVCVRGACGLMNRGGGCGCSGWGGVCACVVCAC